MSCIDARTSTVFEVRADKRGSYFQVPTFTHIAQNTLKILCKIDSFEYMSALGMRHENE